MWGKRYCILEAGSRNEVVLVGKREEERKVTASTVIKLQKAKKALRKFG